MEKYEFEKSLNEMAGMVIGEMAGGILDQDDEDAKKVLKSLRLMKKLAVAQNDDMEILKKQNEVLTEKINEDLCIIKIMK